MTTDNSTDAKTVALDLLNQGEATESEAARMVGVDRQLVHYWAKSAGIDARANRDRHLVKVTRRVKRRR